MSVETISLGCRLNYAESAVIARQPHDGDWIVVNSCAVTAQVLTTVAPAPPRKAAIRALSA